MKTDKRRRGGRNMYEEDEEDEEGKGTAESAERTPKGKKVAGGGELE
jgi:hypothetical protein